MRYTLYMMYPSPHPSPLTGHPKNRGTLRWSLAPLDSMLIHSQCLDNALPQDIDDNFVRASSAALTMRFQLPRHIQAF